MVYYEAGGWKDQMEGSMRIILDERVNAIKQECKKKREDMLPINVDADTVAYK